MRGSLAPDHSVFGPCVSVRRKSFADVGMFCIFVLPLLAVGILFIVDGLSAILAGFTRATEFIIVSVGVLFVAVALCLFQSLLRVVAFYHHGIVDRHWPFRREFAYADAVQFTYALTPRTVKGMYSGTTLRFQLRLANGRRFSFRGIRRENSRNPLVPEARGVEELDTVRNALSAQIAAKMLDRMRTENSVEWCEGVRISPQGLTPSRGRLRGKTINWQEIVLTDYENEQFRIFNGESDSPALSISCNAVNFYPGIELFASYMAESDNAPAA